MSRAQPPARPALPVRVLLAGEETRGRVALVELHEQHGAGPPRHIHAREDEIIYVLEGCVTFDVSGDQLAAPAGTCLVLPRGSEHTYRVESPAARLLVVIAPAGLEGFYRELGRSAASAAPPVEQLVTTAARYGVTITGPGR